MEKISLIIPVYNGEKYIRKCLESALEQEYSNLEIIIINDGSTDGTASMINEMIQGCDHVRVYHKPTNEGLGAARNTGVSLAEGEYISFLDSDDWIMPDYISSLYELLVRTGVDIAIGNFNEYDEGSRQYQLKIFEQDYYEKVYRPQEWFEYQYSKKNRSMCFTVAWGKLYKKSLFEGIAYPDKVFGEDDFTTWKLYLASDRLAYMHKASLLYRITDDSMSHSADEDVVFNVNPVLERIQTLSLIGWDVSAEIRAFKWRAQKVQQASLLRGDMTTYRHISFQLKMMEKYKK